MALTRRGMIIGALGSVLAPSMARAGLRADGGLAFGSSWRISAGEALDLSAVRPLIEAAIAEIDGQMSPFRAGSELSVFNASRTAGWQPMPEALCQVAGEALRVAELTGGGFDPTVGPLVSRFGFGPIKGDTGLFRGIEITVDALRKQSPGLTLDLCGIAKGHALDRIADLMVKAGVFDALIEVGGEVRALGRHPDGRPWKVAIADPRAKGVAAQRIVSLGPLALATSGHSANGLTGPVSTSHIIDPRRGRPASTSLLSVSVLAETGARADALATGFCALGPEAGVRLAQRLDVAALFVTDAAEVMTGQFRRHVLI